MALEGAPASLAAGAALSGLRLRASAEDGRAVSGVALSVSVFGGDGEAWSTTTDASGASPAFDWPLAPLPVAQALEVVAEDGRTWTLPVVPAPGEPPVPADLGGLHAFLAAEGLEGSTEDVAMAPDGDLVMGVPGALVAIDRQGVARRLTTSGEPLEKPLGLAYGPGGDLFIVDVDAEVVWRMTPALEVTRFVAAAGDEAFAGPNDVTVDGRGLAFDADGNLFTIYDTTNPETLLDESIVFVLRHGESTLVRGLAARGRVWANLLFDPQRRGTLYLALLVVPFFTDESARGLEVVDVTRPALVTP